MESPMEGLRLDTALLSLYPIVLNQDNLKIELKRKREEARGKDDYLNDMVLDSAAISQLHVTILSFLASRREMSADEGLDIVLNQKGLDYFKQPPVRRPITSTRLPSINECIDKPFDSLAKVCAVVGRRAALLVDNVPPVHDTNICTEPNSGTVATEVQSASKFIPINRQEKKRPAPPSASEPDLDRKDTTGSSAKKFKAERKSRQALRLQPHEPSPEDGRRRPHHERFCWNLAYWLEDRIGLSLTTDYHKLEDFAAGLFQPLDTLKELKKTDATNLENTNMNPNTPEYRSLRARILIGCAMIFEHNIRGAILNRLDRVHPTCRPHVETQYKYSNIGRAQAQLIGHGTDVTKSSQVFTECVTAGDLPSTEDMPSTSAKSFYQPTDALDQFFPAQARQRLYQDLESWYSAPRVPSLAIPGNLRFVIPAHYVDAVL